MEERYITLKEAMEVMGVSYPTAHSYCKKGIIECKQVYKGRRRSPVYVNYNSIPSFLRRKSL